MNEHDEGYPSRHDRGLAYFCTGCLILAGLIILYKAFAPLFP